MLKIKEASTIWGIDERRIRTLCNLNKIEGAIKIGRDWLIPENAIIPSDGRIKTGKFMKDTISFELPLPIGISNYCLASSEYYYVDKTMMIKEFLDERPMVSLFTRPRRFGKTMNMDMLRAFFEKTDEDTSIYFKNKKIWECGQKYRDYQGKYPVIFITLKDVKGNTWKEVLKYLINVISSEFIRHKSILNSGCFDEKEIKKYNEICDCVAQTEDYVSSLHFLSQMLNKRYGKGTVIIIDEYDTPIQCGYINGFYDDVILFMRNLLSGCLKDNNALAFGFLTGILRVSKESIFSGLNNLTINSILDSKYSEYFGFTKDEVKVMAHYYHADNKFEEICDWYDGYMFGNEEIFNPWSVVNYFRNKCIPKPYWQSTGNNEIIGEILEKADECVFDKLNQLVQGNTIVSYIDTGVIYPQIKNNPSTIYSFLLVAGYLKINKINPMFNGDEICELSLPNKEIMFVYNKEILQRLVNIIPESSAIRVQESLYLMNIVDLKKHIGELLVKSVSVFDALGESFYHGLVLGLCATMDNKYYVQSNRESGLGRYDICLEPKINNLPAMIIELKYEKSSDQKQLEDLARRAIKQINDKNYSIDLINKGIKQIVKFGVAFSGKLVEIVIE